MIDDKTLIARVLTEDDHHAFATLVKKYQNPIRQFVRRLSGGHHDLAEDVAQETFLRIYKKLNTFSGQSSFSTWAHKIAYNCFLKHKQKAHFQNEVQTFELSDFKDTDSSVEKDILIEQLMNNLILSEKTCLTLSISAGMSHQEICEVTSIPLGTVKSHINRGKQKLIDIIALSKADKQ